MGYVVFHMEKARGSDSAMTAHIERTSHPKNADESRTHLNRTLIEYPEGVKDRTAAIQHRLEHAGLKRKIGSNQVRAIRINLSGSPEDMARIEATGQLDAWCADSLQYLFDTFGRENIVSAHLHMDEKTPHIHATLVPIVQAARTRRKKEDQVKRHYRKKSADTPRLCADDIMTRGRLKSYQDGYAKAMSHHGLQRGIDGSEARHISTQQYYRDLKKQSHELQEDITQLQADKAVADEALRHAKREVRVERLKGSAVTAATQITDSIGSLFGGGKVKALEKENEALKKQIESLESQAQKREQHFRQMEQAHREERSRLVEYIEKVKRYFPQVEKLLPLVDFFRKTMHFSEELCRKLCGLKPLKVSGMLYSDEFDRKFPAENTSVAFGHEKETDEHFTLLLDGVDFVRWFRQRMDRLREDMGIPRKQSRGVRR